MKEKISGIPRSVFEKWLVDVDFIDDPDRIVSYLKKSCYFNGAWEPLAREGNLPLLHLLKYDYLEMDVIRPWIHYFNNAKLCPIKDILNADPRFYYSVEGAGIMIPGPYEITLFNGLLYKRSSSYCLLLRGNEYSSWTKLIIEDKKIVSGNIKVKKLSMNLSSWSQENKLAFYANKALYVNPSWNPPTYFTIERFRKMNLNPTNLLRDRESNKTIRTLSFKTLEKTKDKKIIKFNY